MIEYTHIRLIDAGYCLSCRFAEPFTIEVNGKRIAALHCKRLDCDNWITQEDKFPVEETPDGFRRK